MAVMHMGLLYCSWFWVGALFGGGMFPSQISRLPILTFIHLGFVLDSVSMTAPWPPVGITRLQLMCRSVEDIVIVHGA